MGSTFLVNLGMITKMSTTRRMIAPSPMMIGIRLRKGEGLGFPDGFASGAISRVACGDSMCGAVYTGTGSGGLTSSAGGNLFASMAPDIGALPKSLVGSGNLAMVLSYQT